MMTDASVIILLGITGDLSKRKLLPALYQLDLAGLLHDDTVLLGSSRRQVTAAEIFEGVDFGDDQTALDRFKQRLQMVQFNPSDEATYDEIRTVLSKLGDTLRHIFYLSIPPDTLGDAISKMNSNGLTGNGQRLLIEKPYGRDLATAEDLTEIINKNLKPEQVFLIDHFAGKDTVQDIAVFRHENPLFENLLNHTYVASIYVRANEQLDIQGRADFYEQTGALKDMVQSHLLQILSETAMPLPGDVTDADALQKAKRSFLESIQPPAETETVRGQYEGYKDEVANPASTIETFAALKLYSSDPRWQDVPFIVQSGKALAKKTTDVTITFKQTDLTKKATQLVFDIEPSHSISMTTIVKQPGFYDGVFLEQAMRFDFDKDLNGNRIPEAYERIFLDGLRGNHQFFVTPEQAVACWQIIQPVVDRWQSAGDSLSIYAKDSDGPSLEPLL